MFRGAGALYILGAKTTTEPLIKLKIGPHKEEVIFLVDTGLGRSTIQRLPRGCILKKTALVVEAKGEPFKVLILDGVEIESK